MWAAVLIASAGLLLGLASAQQCEQKNTNSPAYSNCIPFGGYGATYKKQGFIYKNVKAFDLGVGSKLRFDLYAPNDYDIIMDVALARTVNNGDWEVTKNSWVTVCRNCNAGRGDSERNNHELTFTTNGDEFRFSGGGLAVRFIPVGSYLSDTTCTQVLQYANPTGADADHFFGRFYADEDGEYPWDGYSASTIGTMIIECQPICDASKCPCPCNKYPCKNGQCKEVSECRGNEYLCTCTKGWYGINCDKECKCSGRGECIATTGKDEYACSCNFDKYWGKDCEKECVQGNCILDKDQNGVQRNVTCSQSDGNGRKCDICAKGWYGQGCESECGAGNCLSQVTCLKDGKNRTCEGDHSCKDGYWGVACDSLCSKGNCKGTVSCFKPDGSNRDCPGQGCASGFWSHDCAERCTNPSGYCTGTVECRQSDGHMRVCLGSCAAGWWGLIVSEDESVCAKPCVQGNCIGAVTCGESGANRQCSTCQPGFYGPGCETACKFTAAQPHCDGVAMCDKNGANPRCSGTCESGWFGLQCDLNHDECASNPCRNGQCRDVVNGWECVCATGYWGRTCEARCSPGNCASADVTTCDQLSGSVASCSQCRPGYYGARCESECSAGNCFGAVSCSQSDPNDRQCSSCRAGWTGKGCQDRCETGNCLSTPTCDQAGGSRVCAGCQSGFYGVDCAQPCAQGNCAGAITCDQSTGGHIVCQACQPGFWGTDCTSRCAQGNCLGAATCSFATGGNPTCSQCIDGYFGSTCTLKCAGSDNCDSSGGRVTCDMNGANLRCDSCKEHWFGTGCQSNKDYCSPNPCRDTCVDLDTGYKCTCAPGYTGRNCTEPCMSATCAQGLLCDQDTGASTSCEACKPGFYGPACETPCGAPNCAGTVTCHKVTGLVTLCSECASGFYGTTCLQRCPPHSNCVNLTCDKLTGSSARCAACVPGWATSTCSVQCSPANCAPGTDTTCDMNNPSSSRCSMCPEGFTFDDNMRCTNCGGDVGAGTDPYCLNGGTCFGNSESTRTCGCTQGFRGTRCESTVDSSGGGGGGGGNGGQNTQGSSSSSSSGLSSVGLAMIIIVVIVVLGLIVFAVYVTHFQKKRSSYAVDQGGSAPSKAAYAGAPGDGETMDNPIFDESADADQAGMDF